MASKLTGQQSAANRRRQATGIGDLPACLYDYNTITAEIRREIWHSGLSEDSQRQHKTTTKRLPINHTHTQAADGSQLWRTKIFVIKTAPHNKLVNIESCITAVQLQSSDRVYISNS